MAKSQNISTSAGNSKNVLIPVDFSQKKDISILVGFELARRLGLEVTLLHATAIAMPGIYPVFPDDFTGLDNEAAEIEEIELENEMHQSDEAAFGRLKKEIDALQKEGNLPDVAYETALAPGMPEEVIAEYCTMRAPAVVVMATRGMDKRQEELIGSVTAEVIDNYTAPVFTVPENYSFPGFKAIVNICAFCNFDDGDFKAVQALMEMFGNPDVKIYLFPANDKLKGASLSDALDSLCGRLAAAYPNATFLKSQVADIRNLRDDAESLFARESIQMILAPNKKRNALSRLFHPGLAHKILYEIDFPMLAIPV